MNQIYRVNECSLSSFYFYCNLILATVRSIQLCYYLDQRKYGQTNCSFIKQVVQMTPGIDQQF